MIAAELEQRLETKVRARVTERILREARVEDQIATALRTIKRPSDASLVKGIRQLFRHKPEKEGAPTSRPSQASEQRCQGCNRTAEQLGGGWP